MAILKPEHISVILFYWHNSTFSKSFKDNFNFFIFFILTIACFVWGLVNFLIVNHFDAIYLFYTIIGLCGMLYFIYQGFTPARNAHKSLLDNNGYHSIHDFYIKRGF